MNAVLLTEVGITGSRMVSEGKGWGELLPRVRLPTPLQIILRLGKENRDF